MSSPRGRHDLCSLVPGFTNEKPEQVTLKPFVRMDREKASRAGRVGAVCEPAEQSLLYL